MWFCATLYMGIQVNRFLGKTDVVNTYDKWLGEICANNPVTRADIEAFYKKNIGGYISAALNTEYAKTRNGYNPAKVYAEWKQKGYGDLPGTAATILTEFFLSPTRRNYESVLGMMARQIQLLGDGDILAGYASTDALKEAIISISPALYSAISDDCNSGPYPIR